MLQPAPVRAPLPEPAVATPGRRRRHERGFWAVGFAFLAVMAFSTVPSPLYGIYQQRDGFSTFVITLIYAAYAIGVVASLFLAGHLSDWHGRRRVLLPAIATATVSSVMFLLWRDLPGLLVARVICGVAVGMLTATATAYLAELHAVSRPGAAPRRSQTVATVANLGGLAIGPLVAGALAQWARWPLTLPYLVSIAMMAVAFVVVARAPETRARPVPRPRYRTQRISVPRHARSAYAAAAAGSFLAFGAMGLFTGLAATLLVGTLHDTSHALAGLAVAVMFGGGVASQLVMASWPVRRILRTGIALMLIGLALTALSAWLATPSLAVFLVGGAVTGAGGGAVFKGAMGTVIGLSEPETRAEALAGLFLAAYVGLSVPVVGAGIALQYLSAKDTLLGFAVLVGVGIVAAAPRLLGRRAGA